MGRVIQRPQARRDLKEAYRYLDSATFSVTFDVTRYVKGLWSLAAAFSEGNS